MPKFWRKKVYAPNAAVVDHTNRGLFVLKGTKQVLSPLWSQIKKKTKSGELGYFGNFANNNQTLIVYISNANNKTDRKTVQKKLLQLIKGLDINIYYRTDKDKSLHQIGGPKHKNKAPIDAIPEQESEEDTSDNVSEDNDSNTESEELVHSDNKTGRVVKRVVKKTITYYEMPLKKQRISNKRSNKRSKH